MAKRRMFSLDIIDTDLFMEMPQSSRLLYYELCMRADDDGFVSSPKKIMKMVGCNEDDFRVLTTKQFIIPFDTGIVVIKHWKIHNYIQKDRYKETIYLDEKSELYQEKNGMYTKCIQDGYTGKDRLGKDRLGKDRLEIGILSCNSCDDNDSYKEIIDYLNLKTGKNFKYTQNNLNKIKTRLKEGFTKDDFKIVIDKKCYEWLKDNKMNTYLRPETLFGSKFESYLQQETKQKSLKDISVEEIEFMKWSEINDKNRIYRTNENIIDGILK